MLDIFKRTYKFVQNSQLRRKFYSILSSFCIAESFFHAQEDSFFSSFNKGLFEVKCSAYVRYVVFKSNFDIFLQYSTWPYTDMDSCSFWAICYWKQIIIFENGFVKARSLKSIHFFCLNFSFIYKITHTVQVYIYCRIAKASIKGECFHNCEKLRKKFFLKKTSLFFSPKIVSKKGW